MKFVEPLFKPVTTSGVDARNRTGTTFEPSPVRTMGGGAFGTWGFGAVVVAG